MSNNSNDGRRYVTATGRAISPGRVTRRSLSVRTKSKKGVNRPLPAELQCHPVHLAPTPVNPGCYTISPWIGESGRLAKLLIEQLQATLSPHTGAHRYIIYRDDDADALPFGATDDIQYAMAVRSALWQNGFADAYFLDTAT